MKCHYDTPRQCIKKQRHYFAEKGLYSQNYDFFSTSHVWMWELDHKESWAPKDWCFWTVVLEKTLESPLYCKIKPVSPKGNQSWIFTGRTDAETGAPIVWPPDAKSQLIKKKKTVQVRCTILDAWGWCTGTTQRVGMGREEGGGFRMGNTCKPVADSFWYLANLIQLFKV